jgi:superoxide reductase
MGGNPIFFVCKHCGNIVEFIKNTGVPMICCGEKLSELVPNTVDASVEKHLPVVTVLGDTVNIQIGSVLHPMEDTHHIAFVYVEATCGGRKCLNLGKEPKISLSFSNGKPLAVYAYCNLHGLWKTEIK